MSNKKHLGFLLYILIAIVIGSISAKILPLVILRSSYSFSLLIKEILMFFLPIIIFSCISSAFGQKSTNGFKLFIIIIAIVCISNFISTMLSYVLGNIFIASSNIVRPEYSIAKNELLPLFSLKLPKLISNDVALFSGALYGIFLSKLNRKWLDNIVDISSAFSKLFLDKFFMPIMPFFVLGFIVKLSYEGLIFNTVSANAKYVLIMVISLFAYMVIITSIASSFSWQRFKAIVFNIFPAAISGFSTMSSAAALPLSIEAAEKNTQNPELAKSCMPLTVSIHLVGDSICVPILAMMLMQYFLGYTPDLGQYLVFVFYFIAAKFSIAAIPGGGMIVMLPTLEKVLGFNNEMIAIITALYILLDPLFTCSNVIGNNLLCIILNKIVPRKAPCEVIP